jgi:hypothetical protein
VHRDVRIAVAELRAAPGTTYDGILGLDVLGRHDFSIDLFRKELGLYPAGSLAGLAHAMGPFTFARIPPGLIIAQVRVNGEPYGALLDTGAPFSIVNRAGAKPRSRIRTVELAGVELDVALVPGAYDDLFHRIGYADRPALVLGVDAFARRTLAIAYQTSRGFLSR